MISILKQWKQVLLGNPIHLRDRKKERLGKLQALSTLSSDALSSVAYASEEILLVFLSLGSIAFIFNFWISGIIVALMAIVIISYMQTIKAYPEGGGAYIVSKANLGSKISLVAAASLLLDYILTVSVSVSAGTKALTSMWPFLQQYSIVIALLSIALITVFNLRGTKESGFIFAIPTYGFVLAMFWMVFSSITSQASIPEIKAFDFSHGEITVFLLLKAFSSGCSAMTGIEAVSDGVGLFREPKSRNANQTLLMMGILLASLFLSMGYLCFKYQVMPADSESVLSQIARHIFGSGIQYQTLQIFTALILLVAANTAFADFPRLASFLARDGYLPKQLMHTGDKLAFSNGIILLSIVAAFLTVLFKADTHALIPLYAIGVFTGFTISQTAMMTHWLKLKQFYWKMALNGFGAFCCFVALLIISGGKFYEGAWIVFIIIPTFIAFFYTIKKHYDKTKQALNVDIHDLLLPQETFSHKNYFKIIIPIKSLHKGVLKALKFAQSLSHDIVFLKVDHDLMTTENYQEKKMIEHLCESYNIKFEILSSKDRSVINPILDYIRETEKNLKNQELIVVLPEFVTQKYWHSLLHNHTAFWIKTFLVQERKKDGNSRIIIDVPYYIEG